MTKRSPNQRRTTIWPCIFSEPFVRDQIDPQVKVIWEEAFRKRAPFGDLRNSWRRVHCGTLNPYGSATCPYEPIDCALALLAAIQETADRRPQVPVGYFLKVAKTSAAKRADEKPLTRLPASGRFTRTGVPEEEGPSPEGSGIPSPTEGQGVHSSQTGFISMGDVLRSLDLRPRESEEHERETSTES